MPKQYIKKFATTSFAQTSQPLLSEQQEVSSPNTLMFILNWLAGAIVFFVLWNVLLPFVLSMQNGYDPALGRTLNNWLFGIGGLIIYFGEPIVHYSFSALYTNPVKIDSKQWPKSWAGSIAEYIGLFLIGMPYAILVWIRPVIRALILYNSFTVLNLGDGESLLFFVIVMSDILLYYSNIVFPNWKYSPNKMIARSAFFKHPAVYWFGSFLSVLFTTIIYSGFAFLAYQQASQETIKGETIILLVSFWYFAIIYTKMDFLKQHIDNFYETIKLMPLRNRLLNLFVIIFSLVGFLWKWFWM